MYTSNRRFAVDREVEYIELVSLALGLSVDPLGGGSEEVMNFFVNACSFSWVNSAVENENLEHVDKHACSTVRRIRPWQSTIHEFQ